MYSDKDIGVPVRARRAQEFSDPNRLINLLVGLDSSRTCNTVNEIFQSESDDRSESRYFLFFLCSVSSTLYRFFKSTGADDELILLRS